MNKKNNKISSENIVKIINILKEHYPEAECSLDFKTPFELLVAVILSAQCTDNRVNLTTPGIFVKYNTPSDFANMDIKTLEELVHPCGFYKNKAKNIKATAQAIINNFDGKIPNNMESLMSLPGVGRKTANVVMLEAFDSPVGIAVDTHCKRIANRIGFSNESEPTKIEMDLLKQIPSKYYKDVNHIFIWHGRNTCTSQHPKCEKCPIKDFCAFFKKNNR